MSKSPLAPCLVLILSACASRATRSEATDHALVPMQHAAAAEVAAEVNALLGGRPTLRALADQRTNSVLLSGTPAEIAEAREILRELDRPIEGG